MSANNRAVKKTHTQNTLSILAAVLLKKRIPMREKQVSRRLEMNAEENGVYTNSSLDIIAETRQLELSFPLFPSRTSA